MIDMTTNNEDAKSFITHFSVDPEKNIYVLEYADGHTATDDCVNSHNDQVYLHRMHQQYNHFKEGYVEAIGKKCARIYLSKFIGFIVTAIALFFDYNIDVHLVMKIIIGLGILCAGFAHDFICKCGLYVYDQVLEHVDTMEYLSKHMKDYYGKILNEETGEVVETQIINFNNVEAFRDTSSMNKMFNILNYKDEESSLKKG